MPKTQSLIRKQKIRRKYFLLFALLAIPLATYFVLRSMASVSPTQIGFENANTSPCTGGVNITPGNSSFNPTTEKAYEGSYSAKASFTGGTANAYARCVVTTNWTTGDDVWYGAAIYLPVGFTQSMQQQVDLMRWDNFSLNNASQDWGGIIIQNSDKKARLKRFNVNNDYVDLGPTFTFPEGRWVWVEVHQRLSPVSGNSTSGAFSEVYMDNTKIGESYLPNTYGRDITRIRFGLVAIGAGSQTNPLDLWVDRATVSNSKIGPISTGQSSSNWSWDARNANVATNSTSIIPKWLKYAKVNPNVPTNSYAVATAEATSNDPSYSIPLTQQGGTITARIPLGSKPDPSSDGHLTVRDVAAGTETDFWQAKYDSVTQRITSASAAIKFPLGSVNVGSTGWSGNAANTPLRRGLITPENVSAAAINETLQFAHRSIGGTTSSYKFPGLHNANTCNRWYQTDAEAQALGLGYNSVADYMADCNANYLPEGTWMRLDPNIDVDAISPALPAWQKTVAKALQNHGVVLRDNGGTLSVYGENTINRGGTAAWGSTGLGSGNSTGFASNFPWDKMQVLDPPPNISSTETCSAKQGDVNNDNKVDIFDLSKVLSNYGKQTSDCADIDRDGTVDGVDLSTLLTKYGT